jgi:protein gp37
MGQDSSIEWTDHTFNPWIGCTKVSAGCAHCYAESIDHRFGGGHWGQGAPRKRTSESNWKQPLAWNRKAERDGTRPRVFCASLADVFDPAVPNEWRADLMDLIDACPCLTWLLLTKRPELVSELIAAAAINGDMFYGPSGGSWVALEWSEGRPPANVWMGTSVEDQAAADQRIPHLLAVPAAKRFLSCEPLLGPVDLSPWVPIPERVYGAQRTGLGIDWVICGGESGPKARPMHPDWARSLRDQCQAAGVAFLFKQWGEWVPCGMVEDETAHPQSMLDGTIMCRVGKKAAGRLLDGRTWDEVPA